MKASIYLGEPLRAALDVLGDETPQTANRSGRINNIAERYLEIVADAMPAFTLEEWCAIMGTNNGLQITGDWLSALHAWANVVDSPEVEEKWGVDPDDLARRMRSLPLASRVAIAEAIERFWGHHRLPTDEALAKAGVKILTEEVRHT